MKFTPKDGGIEVAARRTASQLQISVTDTGMGIEPQFLPHVFEPFRQAELPSTRVHGGLGLGLSIVRYLVEAHGGTILAESEGRGKGSRFVVTLPIRAIVAPGIEVAHAPSEPNVDGLSGLDGSQILVVDDDRDARQLITAVLRRAGATISTADSAGAAIEFLSNNPPPHLILTDIAMPEVDGFALRRMLRERPELDDIPVVALTAFPPTAAGGAEGEFDAYLRKPIDPMALTHEIRQLLQGKAS